MSRDASIPGVARGLVATALAGLGALLAWAIVEMPAEPAGLGQAVREGLGATGVANPVTAVLLNFRAYDTLLEIVVLTLAGVASWSIRAPSSRLAGPPGRVLSAVVALLVPLMVLVGGYVLWAGASEPGGAFQAGAVLAAAGILLLLADLPAVRAPQWSVRLGVALGALVFIGVGLLGVAAGGDFLAYPAGWDAATIVVVEVTSTVSIALILAGIFAGSTQSLAQADDDDAEDAP